MKLIFLGLGILATGTAIVFSQSSFTVNRPDFPTYSYQIVDVRAPAPAPATNQAPATGGAASTVRTSLNVRGGSGATNPIQRTDRNFEIYATELGNRGYRMVHFVPHEGGFRVVFERETLPLPKK